MSIDLICDLEQAEETIEAIKSRIATATSVDDATAENWSDSDSYDVAQLYVCGMPLLLYSKDSEALRRRCDEIISGESGCMSVGTGTFTIVTQTKKPWFFPETEVKKVCFYRASKDDSSIDSAHLVKLKRLVPDNLELYRYSKPVRT